jgi:ATP-binding cassette, subfamily A (ABC1), member 3
VIQRITSSFSDAQLQFVQQVDDPDDVPMSCQQNFNGFSECYAAIVFNSIDESSILNYTIHADAGLFFIDVQGHQSDFEKRVFPLQWAVDQAIIAITTGVEPPAPEEWPFTNESNEEQSLKTRLSMLVFRVSDESNMSRI